MQNFFNTSTSLSSEGSKLDFLSLFLTPFGKAAGAAADLIGLLPKG